MRRRNHEEDVGLNTYYCPNSGMIKAHRCTLVERYKLWKRRRERMKEMIWPWH